MGGIVDELLGGLKSFFFITGRNLFLFIILLS